MRARRQFFMDCHLAGRKYHDADLVWNELKVGTELQLEHEPDNRYDPNAVAVLYTREGEEEPYLLGYIPRAENTPLAHLLEAGWGSLFTCRISQLVPDAHPENQVNLTITLKRNPEAE